ncbi:hypothetical protein CV133_gene16 [Chlorobiaceae phage CV-1-33]|nr:hypothetical protein [Chlorobiaceae bacterium]QOE32023.1 hypothetical protein CV133_gene16 [Chlorobiaceae phage CV-1-33]
MQQRELLSRLNDLAAKYPDFEIHFLSRCDEFVDDGYIGHYMRDVKISDWYTSDEKIYTKECDIRQDIADRFYFDANLTDSEYNSAIDDLYTKNVEKVILVITNAE